MSTEVTTDRITVMTGWSITYKAEDCLFEDGKYWGAIWDRGRFKAEELSPYDNPVLGFKTAVVFYNTGVSSYFPLSPHVKVADIEGAKFAIDDGTHWHFARASIGHHHDFASLVEALSITSFQPLLHSRLRKVATSTNRTVQAAAEAALNAMEDFAEQVRTRAVADILSQPLGYHMEDAEDHHRKVIVKAINTVLEDWKTKALTDVAVKKSRDLIFSDASSIKTKLSTSSTLTTASQRRATAAAAAATKKPATPAEGE